MPFAVLTLRYDPARGVIDDAPLKALGQRAALLAVREHFFNLDNRPGMALLVEYKGPDQPGAHASEAQPRREASVAEPSAGGAFPHGRRP